MSRRDASSAPPGRPIRPARPTQTRRAYKPFSRPEADTVMLPPVSADPDGGPGGRGPDAGRGGRGPGEPGQRTPGGAAPGGRAAGEEPTERTRVLVIPRRRRRELARSPFPPPSPRRTWVSRAVLVAILAVQAALSLRMRNSAFEDEALYLTAGHYELAHLLYGVPLPQDYASFFSGAPVLYPILGALADTAGGLAGARLVSLAAMLTTTALLYSLSRRLFNERVGLCAAVVFSVTESAIFLGNFATYDAPALCLLAVAAWIVVRTATVRWPVYLAAAPVAALAVGTKYAAALFVPTIVAMAALAAWPYQGKRALVRSAALGVSIAGLLAGALWLAGSDYVAAVTSTTTARQHGSTPIALLLKDCLLWGALPFALAVIGSVAYALEARTEPGERIAPPGSRAHRIVLGVVLTGSALLAPLDQIHLHTDVSFQKHIGFGLLFAAPMAGIGLARIIGAHFHRAQFGVAVWGSCLLLGMVQAGHIYDSWPNARPLVAELSRFLAPHAHYLVEVSEVPAYYLMNNPDGRAAQFSSTYFISYTEKNGTTLTGDAGYEQAIRDGYFRVIAYDATVTVPLDRILARMLMNDPQYRLAATLANSDSLGTYYIWVKR